MLARTDYQLNFMYLKYVYARIRSAAYAKSAIMYIQNFTIVENNL